MPDATLPERVVTGAALGPGTNGPSPSDCRRLLERVPELGLAPAAISLGFRVQAFRGLARRDPDVFGSLLGQALAEYVRRRDEAKASAQLERSQATAA